MNQKTTAQPEPLQGEVLALWLEKQAAGLALFSTLGPLHQEELTEGLGWSLELCGHRLRTRIADVTGRTRLVYETAYTLRLRLAVPQGTAKELPADLLDWMERVDTAGQLTDPPPLGEGAYAALERSVGRAFTEEGLWEYRLGLVVRTQKILQA